MTSIINREDYMITMDSFGSVCPANWEEIADYLNDRMDEIINSMIDTDEDGFEIGEDRDITDAVATLWERYCSGELEGAPAASDELWEDR